MVCPRCGSETPSGLSKFCTTCGQDLSGGAPMPQPVSQAVRIPQYVVLQVVLKEKLIGSGSGNLSALENVINQQAAQGYRLHTISTASGGSTGFLGGDRIQATIVFEKL